MSPNVRRTIVRRRKQGFRLDAIANEFGVELYEVMNVLREANVHPCAKRVRPENTREELVRTKKTREELVRKRHILQLLDENTDRKALVAAFGRDAVEDAERSRNDLLRH